MWVKPLRPWGHPKTPKKPLLWVHLRARGDETTHFVPGVWRTHKYIGLISLDDDDYECMNYDFLTLNIYIFKLHVFDRYTNI